MAELAILHFRDAHLFVAATATIMERRFLAAGTTVTTVAIAASTVANSKVVASLAVSDLFLVNVVGKVNSRHFVTTEFQAIFPLRATDRRQGKSGGQPHNQYHQDKFLHYVKVLFQTR